MRLIDADELNAIKEKLRIFDSFISTVTRQCTDEHQAIYEHWIDCRYDIENIIDKLPTAYDIDKVVRQLNLESVGSSIQVSLGLLRAIEIVKQGGVSDDVCEWRLCDEVRAMAKHDKQAYNKAIDDFAEKLSLAFDETIEEHGFYPENLIRQVAEQLKAGGTK